MDLDGIPYVIYVWKHTVVLNIFYFNPDSKRACLYQRKIPVFGLKA